MKKNKEIKPKDIDTDILDEKKVDKEKISKSIKKKNHIFEKNKIVKK